MLELEYFTTNVTGPRALNLCLCIDRMCQMLEPATIRELSEARETFGRRDPLQKPGATKSRKLPWTGSFEPGQAERSLMIRVLKARNVQDLGAVQSGLEFKGRKDRKLPGVLTAQLFPRASSCQRPCSQERQLAVLLVAFRDSDPLE
ncbi:hypothetical protein J6590_061472 [Homalodisca vitripennis]|nr:hypothetical protein J6590_061472 [Homalodisca vitripennis]